MNKKELQAALDKATADRVQAQKDANDADGAAKTAVRAKADSANELSAKSQAAQLALADAFKTETQAAHALAVANGVFNHIGD